MKAYPSLEQHHGVLTARIPLILSCHLSLSAITLGRSSGQHPVAWKEDSCCMGNYQSFYTTFPGLCQNSVLTHSFMRRTNATIVRSVYNTKLHLVVRLQLWRMQSTLSLPLLLGPIWPRVVILVKVPSTGQIDLFENYSYLIEILDTL